MASEVLRDVAVSFLFRDEPFARDLVARLDGYTSFYFPKKQEELAGTDGMETLRNAFRTQSLLNVALYRDGWGQTPWTRVEATAIQEAALAKGWDSLLFVTLDVKSTVPAWLPDTRIRLNLWQYGEAELVGAIKLRLKQLGATHVEEDALGVGRRLAERARLEARREQLLLVEGPTQVRGMCLSLFERLKGIANELQASHGFDLEVRFDELGCGIHADRGSLSLRWEQRFGNSLDDSHLLVREYFDRTSKGGLPTVHATTRTARQSFEAKYVFDWQPAFEWCWTDRRNSYTSESLADKLLKRFLNTLTRPLDDHAPLPLRF